MHLRIFLLVFGLSSQSTSVTHGDGFESDPFEFELTHTRLASLRTGMTRGAVRTQIGQPSEALSEEIWIYRDFHARHRPSVERTDALIVVFREDRVTHLRLTRYDLIAVAAAQARARTRTAQSTNPARHR